MTSMAEQLGPLEIAQVRHALTEELGKALGRQAIAAAA
jgi:lipoate-protein ligase B